MMSEPHIAGPRPVNWSPSGAAPVHVTVSSRTALVEDMRLRLRTGRGFAVATLNLDHVVKLRRDPAFRAAYEAQTHVTADGNPIVWLSRLAGHDIELVTGSDLVRPVAALAAQEGRPVALVGATEATLATAAERLAAEYPGLDVVARIAPPMGFDAEGPGADAMIDAVAAAGARLCLVALGAPRQEIFAARALARHPGIGFLSIGAGLDFVAGQQNRAPGWVRAVAGEWLWRLLGNPGRLAGRYAACAAILPGLTLSVLRQRRAPE